MATVNDSHHDIFVATFDLLNLGLAVNYGRQILQKTRDPKYLRLMLIADCALCGRSIATYLHRVITDAGRIFYPSHDCPHCKQRVDGNTVHYREVREG
jgi:hypothetical protein